MIIICYKKRPCDRNNNMEGEEYERDEEVGEEERDEGGIKVFRQPISRFGRNEYLFGRPA